MNNDERATGEAAAGLAAARLLKAAGDVGRAREAYHRLLEAEPSCAEALHGLGGIAYRLGELDRAVEWLSRAVALAGDNPLLHSNLGAAYRAAGRLAEAEACHRKALRLQPDVALAYNNLGNVLRELGRPAEAEARYRQAILASPGYADARRNLDLLLAAQGGVGPPEKRRPRADAAPPADAAERPALALLRGNKPEDAEAHCREALRLDPDRPRLLVALGRALARQGRLAEAALAFHHAVRVDPVFAEAYCRLGAALREQGDLGRAVGYLRHALDLRPGLVEGHNQLGLALVDLGALEEAAAAYREALRLQPDSVFALSHLGALLEELAEADEGNALLEQALRLDPDDWQVHTHYGAALVNRGRHEEARPHFLRALELRPDCAPAWFSLARDAGRPFSDAEVSHIRDLLGREHLPPHDRINLHFALARVHDRAGEFDEAFRHCDQGAAAKARLLQLRGTAYQPETHARYVDRLIAAFGPAHFERTRSFGAPAEEPIFIVGMPRSGTSLVEQILASHPSVFGAGELRNVKQFADELPTELGGAEYPECLAGLDRETARRLGERYVQRLRPLGRGKPRITDKMPMNFHHLGLLATLLPRAPIICCRRDARDVCWSCYFQNFRDVPFACDLRQLGAYHRQYERLMEHWRAVLPVPILDICYEELTAEPERVSREIVAFCRLPWHVGCLDFHRTPRVVRTASNLQVRRPIYRSSVDYWRNYETHLGPLLEALAPKCGE